MRSSLLLPLIAALFASGCESVECGDGTIERDGACVPADQTVGTAKCGRFTMLVGDVCVPMFAPTVCQDGTTLPDVDPSTGVTTCIGTGTGGCDAPLACPIPTDGKQTICGRLFDFQTNAPFTAAAPREARCTGTEGGPCTLGIRAYDAISFASNPGAAVPLAVADNFIDDCGRYRLTDITVPAGPFIALGIDDATQGPGGTTNPTGVATPTAPGTATKNLEAFVAPAATTTAWQSSGGPAISGGIYAMIFRASRTGATNNRGVTPTLAGSPVSTANDFYFASDDPARTTIDPAAVATGLNGTALVTNASVAQGVEYSGAGGLPAECVYTKHAGAAVANILFVQVLRPTNAPSATCPL